MKPLVWMGNSYRVVTSWPKAVMRAVGYQLHLIENGEDPDDWKPMKTIGAGVREVRVHVDGEYRIIYLAKFEEGVYLLHAFEKKTQRTSKADIQLAKDRLKEVNRERQS